MNLHTILRKIFFLTLLFGFVLPGLYAQKGSKDENPLARLEHEILAYEAGDKEKAPPESAILFVGSSSVRMWKTMDEDLSPLRVLNRGFGGSTFPELLYYYDRLVKPYKPKAIVVYEGDNDLTKPEMTPQKVLNNLKIFHSKVQMDFPGTKVWFLAIKPSIARKKLLATVQKTNAMIEKFADETPHLEYLDVASVMLNKDGSIKSDIFIRDNLHMNAKGYELWTGVVKPTLLKVYNIQSTE